MKRREFLSVLGGLAVGWPLVARAQRSTSPVIGFLNGGVAAKWQHLVEGFRKGLSEGGYVEDQNIIIEYRWAEGKWDRLPGLAAELIQRKVDVIASGGGDPPALAARDATKTIPLCTQVGRPGQNGLVSSLNRPAATSRALQALLQ